MLHQMIFLIFLLIHKILSHDEFISFINLKNYSRNSKNAFIFENILFYACLSGNFNLVKYIIKLDKIDITIVSIFYLVFF